MNRCPKCQYSWRLLTFFQTQRLYRKTCAHMGVDPERLPTPLRHQHLVEKRWIVAWVLRTHGAKLTDIGTVLRRDHHAIIHGIDEVQSRLNSADSDSWQRLIDIANGDRKGVYAKQSPDSERSGRHAAGPSEHHLSSAQASGVTGVQDR